MNPACARTESASLTNAIRELFRGADQLLTPNIVRKIGNEVPLFEDRNDDRENAKRKTISLIQSIPVSDHASQRITILSLSIVRSGKRGSVTEKRT